MPIRFEFQDARDWRYLMESLNAIVDEASFIMDGEALKLRALDPSRIAMVDLHVPREAFSIYDIGESQVKIGVNFDDLNKVLRRAKAEDKIIFEIEGRRFKVILAGKAERSFSLPLIDVMGEELPTPRVTFDVVAKMLSDTFRDSLKDAEMISDTVKFIGEENTLKIIAKSDKGELEAKFSPESGSLIEYEVRQPSIASYSLNYLDDIVSKAYRISELVTVEFSSNKPLSLSFEIVGGGTLRYYLAPRLEA